MEASTTVRGGQQERAALELHHHQEVVSKSIYLGHNPRGVEHTAPEASAPLPAGARRKKRALELRSYDDDDDDDGYWEEEEAAFVAGADGAYIDIEMTKRIHLGYNVGVSSARIRRLEAEDERDVALRHRHRILANAMIRDMYAEYQARQQAAAAAPRT